MTSRWWLLGVLVVALAVFVFAPRRRTRLSSAEMPGSSCKTWQPCWTVPTHPLTCCFDKPRGCDSTCDVLADMTHPDLRRPPPGTPVPPRPRPDTASPMYGSKQQCEAGKRCAGLPTADQRLACCMAKPYGCETSCDAVYHAWRVQAPVLFGVASVPATPCAEWPRCQTVSDPLRCCFTRPPGCDPFCDGLRERWRTLGTRAGAGG